MQREHILWATDVHLDHAGGAQAARDFGANLRRLHADARGLVITGDIAGARDVVDVLEALEEGWRRPLYFVLGNHDYYRGRFRLVDDQVRRATSQNKHLTWLREGGHRLNETTIFVGTDGWYDARYGNTETPIQLSDFMQIADLFEALDDSLSTMHQLIRARADQLAAGLEEEAAHLLQDKKIREALIAVHVPPFVEASWYQGKPGHEDYSPYFASRATGDALLRLVDAHPEVRFTTLCGHTHHEGVYSPRENLCVFTGRAKYGAPTLAGVVDTIPRISVELYRSPA